MPRPARFLLAALAANHPAPAAAKPVRVFLLAGQSNREGHGRVAADPNRSGGKGSLEFVAKDPSTAKRFAALVDSPRQWRTRDDVWISYLDRKGPLTVGCGVRKDETIGPEPGFGWVMGDALEEPVLLIKRAWGGKRLAVDFRPPSADKPPHSLGEKGDAAITAAPALLGKSCRETLMSGPEETHPRALSRMRAQAALAERNEFKGNVASVSTRAYWRPKEQSPAGQGCHWDSNAETYCRIGEAMGPAMKRLSAKRCCPERTERSL